MIKPCNNKSSCHDPFVIHEGDGAMRAICKQCKQKIVVRLDPIKHVPVNRQYSKFFRRLTLQGNTNLFYKYYGQYLSR